MAWVYLDDQFPDHPKVVAVGDAAAWLFVCGLAYCKRYSTAGRIPKAQVPKLTAQRNAPALAGKLVSAPAGFTSGLWEDGGDHYRVHDYDDWNRANESRSEAGRRAANARWARKTQDAEAPESTCDVDANAYADAPETHLPQDALSLSLSQGITSTSPLASSTDPPDGRISRRIWEAALVLGHREAARRQADHPEAYARSLIPKLQAAHSAEWRWLLDRQPDLTAEQLADRTGPRDPTPSVDLTQALIDSLERAERAKPPARPSNLANLGRHRPEDAA